MEDESFDIVSQSTVMSSILADSDRQRMAKEMIRVLRPGGIILWSDFRLNSPANKNVRKVTRREIETLFSGLDLYLKSTNLLPPMVRRLAPLSNTLTSFFDSFPILHSHLRGVFVKNGSQK
jgi:ubiquinone/menaquinone biosynthesis C-methylase UbiE